MRITETQMTKIIGFLSLSLFGLIPVSCDENTSWKTLSSSNSLHAAAYTDVVFYDKNEGLLSGLGEIKKSNDGGESWTALTTPERVVVSSFEIENNRTWGVGAQPRTPSVIYSDDRGKTWRLANIFSSLGLAWSEGFSIFYDVCFDREGRVWLAGDAGILETKLNGDQFDVVSVVKTEWPIYSLALFGGDDKNIVGVGGHGIIFRSFPEPRIETIGKADNLFKVRIFGRDIWIAGSSEGKGVLYRSSDDGRSWESKGPASTTALYDVFMLKRHGWLVGASGLIFRTVDNGDTWKSDTSPTNNDLQRVFYLDSKNIWISGDKATVLKNVR